MGWVGKNSSFTSSIHAPYVCVLNVVKCCPGVPVFAALLKLRRVAEGNRLCTWEPWGGVGPVEEQGTVLCVAGISRTKGDDRKEATMNGFFKRGKKRDAAWLAFLMFAVGVLFMGFHNDLAFWIAGSLGIVAGALAFLFKLEVR